MLTRHNKLIFCSLKLHDDFEKQAGNLTSER